MPIFKYEKSGKYFAVDKIPYAEKISLLDLTDDLKELKQVRNIKYLKYSSIEKINFMLEVHSINQKSNNNQILVRYQMIRILSESDIDKDRWINTDSLNNLPVGPYLEINEEELAWAGKRKGNISYGTALIFVFISLMYLAFFSEQLSSKIFFGLVSGFIGISLYGFKWQKTINAKEDKITELKNYKKQLISNIENRMIENKTAFETMLGEFKNWETLSPQDFEIAVKTHLTKSGYDLQNTSYSKDGGIDLKGCDKLGNKVIVQAKKYSKNVGVSVVREMIGVREHDSEKPKVIIVSLVGFTFGARELAKASNIELISIKEDILKV